MIRAVLIQACRIAPVAFLAAGVVVAIPALAETAKKGPSVTAGSAEVAKDPATDVEPVSVDDASAAKTDKQTEKPADGPSTGLSVLDRMGADLPALPAEKPFTGKIDEAYGAFQRGRYLTAMELALPRAQLGDPAAQTLVAEVLDRGLGVKRNREQAMFWYEQAAGGGDPTGMFKYAILLMERSGSREDRTRADELMKKSAELGNASAQFNYAQVLVADSPGEKGLRAALPYYEKSAEQGIADAQYAVSQIYIGLKDLPEEKTRRAREWLLRAARAGFDTAQLDLGMWLVNGTGGERDYEAGFKWLKRAAGGGNAVAQSKLAQLYIHAIGTKADPVEAGKWFVLARRAGLNDPSLEDFYLGLSDTQQKAAVDAANKYRSGS
ncbi:tetratricopeptide repeat protein [Shinella sp. JR1-6]|uniref:tetratricopeptide repeat protein n=1 Tax=Shinella sp. JR1-6 TaxID=2527671 RepID=UPI00102D4217|nr:tetratricopeptide repeat protein [Shinella sp. JR1-6]TAA64924.1 sel1 repeat family protein [Shinella sp. JR1-6]